MCDERLVISTALFWMARSVEIQGMQSLLDTRRRLRRRRVELVAKGVDGRVEQGILHKSS